MKLEEFLMKDAARADLFTEICKLNDLGLLRLLWEKGMPLYQPISMNGYSEDYNFGQKLMLKACSMGDLEFARLLLEQRIDLDQFIAFQGYSDGGQIFRYRILELLQNNEVSEFIRIYRCNGREPLPMVKIRSLNNCP